MRRRFRASVLTLLALAAFVAFTTPAAAQARRLHGTITDTEGTPLPDVTITATSPDLSTFKLVETTNKKGEFTLVLLSRSIATAGTVKAVKLHLEKAGFGAKDESFDMPDGDHKVEYKLESAAAVAARQAALQAAEEAKRGPDVSALHNAGADAAKAGDYAGAAAKFEEALKVQEDVPITHAALAAMALKLKENARAEQHARRALELNPAQPQMHELLAEALEAQGKTAEAAAINTKLAEGDPKLKATLAFNRGADLVMQRKDAEAMAAFEEATLADPTLPEARYQLGAAAFRQSDMAKAREHLAKYLELAPEGKNAATATALLKAAASAPAPTAKAAAPAGASGKAVRKPVTKKKPATK